MRIQLPITVPLGKGGHALDFFPSGRTLYVRRTLTASKELAAFGQRMNIYHFVRVPLHHTSRNATTSARQEPRPPESDIFD